MSYALFQLAFAKQAPGYLGVNTTTSAFRINLPGVLGAADAERASGWNAAAVLGWAWSDKWRSAAFASIVSLTMPDKDKSGRVTAARGALNLTYTPVASLDFTAELGLASVESGVSLLPSARQVTLIVSVRQSFP
jgi:hypothetical protein